MDPKEEDATIAIMMNPRYGKKIQDTARRKLLTSHIRLIYSVAYMYARRYNKVVGDLFQAGYIGMFNATLKYDPSRGVKFTSFAIWWITQKIQEEIYVENCKVHCPMYTKAEAARHEDAAKFDMFDQSGKKFLHAMPTVLSTDLPLKSKKFSMEKEGTALCDTIESKWNPVYEVESDDDDRKLGEVLREVLNSQEYRILKDAYYNGMTQAQVGEQYGLSGERIRQKLNRAKVIARNALRKLEKEGKFSYRNIPSECNLNTLFKEKDISKC
jgi:RNA polymerase sigma factor (sigma-70 family)